MRKGIFGSSLPHLYHGRRKNPQNQNIVVFVTEKAQCFYTQQPSYTLGYLMLLRVAQSLCPLTNQSLH